MKISKKNREIGELYEYIHKSNDIIVSIQACIVCSNSKNSLTLVAKHMLTIENDCLIIHLKIIIFKYCFAHFIIMRIWVFYCMLLYSGIQWSHSCVLLWPDHWTKWPSHTYAYNIKNTCACTHYESWNFLMIFIKSSISLKLQTVMGWIPYVFSHTHHFKCAFIITILSLSYSKILFRMSSFLKMLASKPHS